MPELPEPAASELRTLIEAKLREQFHRNGFCPACCLVCGWCGPEPHECVTTAEPKGLVVDESGDLMLSDGTRFPDA